jgi:hypothetical protein
MCCFIAACRAALWALVDEAEYLLCTLPDGSRLAASNLSCHPSLCCNAAACSAALRELVGEAEYFLGILPDGSGLAAA